MASTGQAHENHNRKLDGRSPLVLLLQLLRSLCPIVANGRRLEERGVQHLVKNKSIFRTAITAWSSSKSPRADFSKDKTPRTPLCTKGLVGASHR